MNAVARGDIATSIANGREDAAHFPLAGLLDHAADGGQSRGGRAGESGVVSRALQRVDHLVADVEAALLRVLAVLLLEGDAFGCEIGGSAREPWVAGELGSLAESRGQDPSAVGVRLVVALAAFEDGGFEQLAGGGSDVGNQLFQAGHELGELGALFAQDEQGTRRFEDVDGDAMEGVASFGEAAVFGLPGVFPFRIRGALSRLGWGRRGRRPLRFCRRRRGTCRRAGGRCGDERPR